jgi:hypothetical protein
VIVIGFRFKWYTFYKMLPKYEMHCRNLCRLDNSGSIPRRISHCLQPLQTYSGGHPTSMQVDTGGFLPGGKRPETSAISAETDNARRFISISLRFLRVVLGHRG